MLYRRLEIVDSTCRNKIDCHDIEANIRLLKYGIVNLTTEDLKRELEGLQMLTLLLFTLTYSWNNSRN